MQAPGRAGWRVLAIDPGSTSTRWALYVDDNPVHEVTLRHLDAELEAYVRVWDQIPYRLERLRSSLAGRGVRVEDLHGVVARGGLLAPIPGGTYSVDAAMLDDLARAERGEHASNLGAPLAAHLAEPAGLPAWVVDPVSVDEMEPVARLSGLPGIERRSLCHALNMRAAARRLAQDLGVPYPSLRLVTVHLGSGVSLAAHRDGRMVDVCNPNDEGPFSPERTGSLPVTQMVDLCFSGRYTADELKRALVRRGGLVAYTGSRHLPDVLARAGADPEVRLALDAFVYQVAKEVGALATVLEGRVDWILLTGGGAHAAELVAALTERVRFLAPVRVDPGEHELEALVQGALRVLRNQEPARFYGIMCGG
ncbi:butyrate kinase [Limnochorda pilosa]|uniref:Probable butyrate kinase n=1 Tax=Limnochorda pilosa TaxID=1555112 RepID=A0A0K2SFT7_LIMPI|nr:butyrate kinase [Limnochorda pilosa]BAS25955.1 butyrate kinase [Limnochorda pilosa]